MSDIRNADIALALLDPHGRNYRRHPESQVTRLQASLQKFGQPRSIVVQAQGERYRIVAGHGVTLAAQALGWASLRCDVLPEEWPEERVAAYLVADNELSRLAEDDDAALLSILDEARQYDDELLAAMGYDEAEFQALLAEVGPDDPAEDPGPQTDRAEELRQQWGVEPGQLWRLGEHRLICGDCTDPAVVERVMGGERADAVVTDPPYSSGGFTRGDRTLRTSDKYIQTGTKDKGLDFAGDNRDQRSWIAWCERWLAYYATICESGAVLAIWTDWRQLPALTDAVQGGGWVWRGISVWDKTEAARPLYGRFRPQSEFLVWGSLGGLALNDGRPCYPGVIRQAVDGDKMHQTQKPVNVVAWSMSMADSLAVVLDPFSGSGTTLIACEQLGRRCRAVEIAPGYVAVALQRWADMTGQTPELLP